MSITAVHPIGHGTALVAWQDPVDESQSVCRPLSVTAVSCFIARLTLVCATGQQTEEILIETFRFNTAESFLSS
jgi:hypothetical protein